MKSTTTTRNERHQNSREQASRLFKSKHQASSLFSKHQASSLFMKCKRTSIKLRIQQIHGNRLRLPAPRDKEIHRKECTRNTYHQTLHCSTPREQARRAKEQASRLEFNKSTEIYYDYRNERHQNSHEECTRVHHPTLQFLANRTRMKTVQESKHQASNSTNPLTARTELETKIFTQWIH